MYSGSNSPHPASQSAGGRHSTPWRPRGGAAHLPHRYTRTRHGGDREAEFARPVRAEGEGDAEERNPDRGA